MDVPSLVQRFYDDLWNEVALDHAHVILHPEVTFRGSLGTGASGIEEVSAYITMVTTALSGYRCDVEHLVAEGDHAAAKVRFSGRQVGTFLGRAATGRDVTWIGAAFFTADGGLLRDIWVLGDLVSLHTQLDAAG